jgi:hypothetical protein
MKRRDPAENGFAGYVGFALGPFVMLPVLLSPCYARYWNEKSESIHARTARRAALVFFLFSFLGSSSLNSVNEHTTRLCLCKAGVDWETYVTEQKRA